MTGTDTKPVSDPTNDEGGEAEMDEESLREFVERQYARTRRCTNGWPILEDKTSLA